MKLLFVSLDLSFLVPMCKASCDFFKEMIQYAVRDPGPDRRGSECAKKTRKVSPIVAITLALISLSLPACELHKEQTNGEGHQKVVATSPLVRDETIIQPYVCQIHSQRHINVRALQSGYLEEVLVKEGQEVKKGEVMFRILPTVYEANYEAEKAEAKFAEIELFNTRKLFEDKIVSNQLVALHQAKLARAQAKAAQAKAELNFCVVRARFAGIVDTLHEREGSLIKERDILTTLSDNSVMWVYFNVPESRYFEYKALESRAYPSTALQGKNRDNSQLLELVDSRIELQLADGHLFNYSAGNIVTVEAQFDNRTGNLPFRADFPNPERLLRHGQTGTVLVYRTLHNSMVIPQRAVSELLDKQYVFVIDEQGVVHQRVIGVLHELEDRFIIDPERVVKKGKIVKGLDVNDRIVLEGGPQVRDGAKVEEYEFRKPAEVLKNQKNPAE